MHQAHNIVGHGFNCVFTGDFDGDGRTDFMLTGSDGSQYQSFMTSPGIYGRVNEFVSFNPSDFTSPNYGDPNKLFPDAKYVSAIDFDGDHKNELFFTNKRNSINESYIITFSRNSASNTWIGKKLYQRYYPNQDDIINFGYFNGDGKTDLLTRLAGTNNWNIAISTGTSYPLLTSNFSFNNTPICGSCTPRRGALHFEDFIQLGDFNGDGRTDIFHLRQNDNGTQGSTIYYSKKTNYTNNDFFSVNSSSPTENISSWSFGDFNSDGKQDFLSYYPGSSPDEWKFNTIGSFKDDAALLQVRDGFGKLTTFQHVNLTNYAANNSYNYYTNTGLTNYPLNTLNLPLWTVREVQSPDGNGGMRSVFYNYEDARFHRAGKGFLGFKKLTSKDNATNFVSEHQTLLNSTFFTPTTSITKLSGILNGIPIDISRQTASFSTTSLGSFKRYKLQNTSSFDEDLLKSTWVTTNHTYDVYGNITNTTQNNYNIENTSTQNIYAPASQSLTPVPAFSYQTTTTKTRTTGPSVTSTVYYQMSSGLVWNKVDQPGLPLNITSYFTYYPNGALKTTTVSGSGATTKVSSMTYDQLFRFVGSTTNPAGQVEYFLYDSKWGNVQTHVDFGGLYTNYSFDNFGLLTQTTLPDFNVQSTSRSWNSIPSINAIYSVSHDQPGQNNSISYFDALGRVKRAYNAIWQTGTGTSATPVYSISDKTYDAKGNILIETQPHFSYETSGWLTNTNSYDGLNRITSNCNALGCTNYSYTYLTTLYSVGNVLKTKVTSPSSQITETDVDATGKVLSTKDDGGDVQNDYDSWGNLIYSNVSQGYILRHEYDLYNRLTKVTDPDGGISLSSYDAFGNLTSQTDGNGNVQTMTYDVLGNILTRTGSEGTTTYSYYTSGAAINKLSSINSFIPGYGTAYTYDALGNLSAENEQINGTGYTTSYSYDTWGRLAGKIYPNSGPSISYSYNNYGAMTDVIMDDNGTPINLYSITSINGRGQTLTATRGNGLSSALSYTYGHPVNFYTGGIQDYSLTYDFLTGNIQQRIDNNKSITEDFTYDNLNRLTSAQIPTSTTLPSLLTVYDGGIGTSTTKGNIIYKSNVGNLFYFPATPHAVSFTDNAASNVPTLVQNVSYTPFQKAATVTEGIYHQNFTYGADYERKKTELFQGPTLLETRLYLGSGSEQHTDAMTGAQKDIFYISGPDGIAAILFHQTADGSGNTVYYPYTDHLGSIQAVSDDAGNVVFEQAFDAWGKLRHTNDWSADDYSHFPAAWSWIRGFTGHEHMPHFGIINMNGRMYDPLLGRMFSPDRYIQNPQFTQSYNRYSYCWNSPLRYTDPSGELLDGMLWASAYLGELCSNLISGESRPFAKANTTANNVTNELGSFGQVTVYQDDHSTLSMGFDVLNLGVGVKYNYHNGDFNANAGVGLGLGGFSGASNVVSGAATFSENLHIGDASVVLGAGGGTNGSTYSYSGSIQAAYSGYSLSYSSNHYGGANGDGYAPQNTGTIGIGINDFHISHENDFLTSGGEDRFRTAALSIGVGRVSVVANINTNDPGNISPLPIDEGRGRPSKIWGYNTGFFNGKKFTSWANGQVFGSSLGFAYSDGVRSSQISFGASVFQDFIQNGMHQSFFRPGNQNYYLDYGHLSRGFSSFGGYLNPYSLYTK